MLIFFLTFSGCMKKGAAIFGTAGDEDKALLKKMWVMPFPVSGESAMSLKFGGLLEKSFASEKSVFLVNAHKADFKGLPEKLPLLPGGRINNSALSGIAEEAGIQAVGVFSAVDLTFDEKYTEAFWLSKRRWYAKAFFSFSMYDTETSSKSADFFIEESVRISEEDYNLYSKSPEKIPEAIVAELVQQASTNVKEKAMEEFLKIPWKGFITEVNGNKVRISSGNEIMIKPGMELDILNLGEMFEGRDGFKYRVPGDKIGKIAISRIGDYYSEAEIPAGMVLSKGMALRPAEVEVK